MKLVIDMAKDSVEELKKAVEVLKQVVQNKENNEHFAKGLERFGIDDPRAHPEKLPPQAQKMLEQEKMMEEIEISKLLEKRYKRKF